MKKIKNLVFLSFVALLSSCKISLDSIKEAKLEKYENQVSRAEFAFEYDTLYDTYAYKDIYNFDKDFVLTIKEFSEEITCIYHNEKKDYESTTLSKSVEYIEYDADTKQINRYSKSQLKEVDETSINESTSKTDSIITKIDDITYSIDKITNLYLSLDGFTLDFYLNTYISKGLDALVFEDQDEALYHIDNENRFTSSFSSYESTSDVSGLNENKYSVATQITLSEGEYKAVCVEKTYEKYENENVASDSYGTSSYDILLEFKDVNFKPVDISKYIEL